MILLLEIARGMAALWVFLFHAQDLFKESSLLIFYVAQYGALGVPMFFVISGYVITYSAESCIKDNLPATDFLRKRILRIYPAFWVSVFVVLVAPLVIETISMFKSGYFNAPDFLIARYDLTEWINFLLLTKIFFSENGDLQGQFNAINSVYWSLAIEMQFYVVMFMALCLRKYYRLLITIVTLLSVINLVTSIPINSGVFIHFWPMFSLGIALAYLHKQGFSFEKLLGLFSGYSLIASTGLVVCSIVVFFGWMKTGLQSSLFFAAFFAFLLWAIAPFERVLVGWKSGSNICFRVLINPLLILGAMSYSIYLLHGKIFQIPNMFVRQIIGESSFLYGVATIAATLVLCYPFYLIIERRFMSKNYSNLHKQTLGRAD